MKETTLIFEDCLEIFFKGRTQKAPSTFERDSIWSSLSFSAISRSLILQKLHCNWFKFSYLPHFEQGFFRVIHCLYVSFWNSVDKVTQLSGPITPSGAALLLTLSFIHAWKWAFGTPGDHFGLSPQTGTPNRIWADTRGYFTCVAISTSFRIFMLFIFIIQQHFNHRLCHGFLEIGKPGVLVKLCLVDSKC